MWNSNFYWNNTCENLTCQFIIGSVHDSYTLYLVIDANNNNNFYDDTWNSIATGTSTGLRSETISYSIINALNPSPSYSYDGKKFKIFVRRVDNYLSVSDTLIAINTFIYRLEPPLTPSAPDLIASYDTGISSTDNITNKTELSFTITNVAVDNANKQIQLINAPYGFYNNNLSSELTSFVTTTNDTTTLIKSGITET